MATSTSSTNADQHPLISVNDDLLFDYLNKWITIHLDDEETLNELSSSDCHRETYPIEKYPCQMFLVDLEPCKRVRVWLNEREVEVDKCSDYMYEKYTEKRMKSCWVLWIHENLPVKQSCRERLLNVLYKLNEERQDFHPNPSPVEDIIDPDLLPYRPPSTFDRNKWIERQQRRRRHSPRREDRFKRDLARGGYDDLSEHEKLRDTYQWLPSEFVIDKNGKVDIRTPIIHLPELPEYRQSYDDIAKIFQAMLPMFEQMKLIKLSSNEEQKLQVIVKAQSYNLKSGMKYSGRWHTEGQTENIVAVGVYYLDIDDQLEGGSLKFRPKVGPNKSYADGIEMNHYVSSIKTDGRRRTFLNFFIVDPEQPIEISPNEIVYAPKDFLIQIFKQWNDQGLPDIIIDKIFKMLNLSAIWETKDFAKEFRARVRRAMLDEKTGWGWIQWGNTGTTDFVRSLSAWRPNKRDEAGGILHHTESD
ncbi:unnamed protein product [Adineta steineri]|uniref:DUF4246 domain-containing protein n=1 Tax=Adineta steineri TaxID=433720 RepID=A0A814VRD1_9BILA|nr:unnamed protein product [Adineta steineri]CAF1452304.1 unnamed protein product [Adineta steineri]